MATAEKKQAEPTLAPTGNESVGQFKVLATGVPVTHNKELIRAKLKEDKEVRPALVVYHEGEIIELDEEDAARLVSIEAVEPLENVVEREQLEAEIAKLRGKVAELEQKIAEKHREAQERWTDREQEIARSRGPLP